MGADLDRLVREAGCLALIVPGARKGSRTIQIVVPKGQRCPFVVEDLLKDALRRKAYVEFLNRQASFNNVT